MEHATLISFGEQHDTPLKPPTRYEDDAHAWAFEQAALLKAGRFTELDILNLADEIEDVGHHEYDKLESNLAIVVQHLLKWDYQESHRSRSWVNSIRKHRKRVSRLLQRFRSLNTRQNEALIEAFERGRGDAVMETDLPEGTFPETNPYSWDDVMTRSIDWAAP